MSITTNGWLIAALWIGSNVCSAQSGGAASEAEWSRRGDALMEKSRQSMDASLYAQAEAAYQESLKVKPEYGNALTGMAWVALARHDYAQTAEWANRALKAEPERADAYGLLGDAAVETGDYESAFEHYQKMLDLKPSTASYSRAARLMFLTGNFKRANLMLVKALGAVGTNAENKAWCVAQLALLEFAQGSYVSAEQKLTRGLSESPNNYPLLAAMARVKAALKAYEAAIGYYEKAQAVSKRTDVAIALGDLYKLAGRTEDAERQYKLAEALRGVDGGTEWALFLADHDRNFDEALRLAEAEYKARPTVYAADALAWCFYKSGRLKEAQKFMAKALAQGTPEAMFLYHKGAILAKAGNVGGARKLLYQALSQNPNFDPIAAPVALQMVRELGAVAVDGH